MTRTYQNQLNQAMKMKSLYWETLRYNRSTPRTIIPVTEETICQTAAVQISWKLLADWRESYVECETRGGTNNHTQAQPNR